MEEDESKRFMEPKAEGMGERRRRSKLRWMDGMGEDLSKVGNKGWWMVAKDRELWRKIYRKIEALAGCSTEDDNDDTYKLYIFSIPVSN